MEVSVAVTERSLVVEELSKRVLTLGSPSEALLFRFFKYLFKKHFEKLLNALILREQEGLLKELQNTLWEENLLKREKEFEELIAKNTEAFQAIEDDLVEQGNKVRRIVRQTKEQIKDLTEKSLRAENVLALLNAEITEKREKLAKLESEYGEVTNLLNATRAELVRRKRLIAEIKAAEVRFETLSKQVDELSRSSALIRAEIERMIEIRDQIEVQQNLTVSCRSEEQKDKKKKEEKNHPPVVVSYADIHREQGLSSVPDIIDVSTEELKSFIGLHEYERWKAFEERLQALCLLKKANLQVRFGGIVTKTVYFNDSGPVYCILNNATTIYEQIKNGGMTDSEKRVHAEAKRISNFLLSRNPNKQKELT
jgi:hypothetical protein